MKRLLVIEDGFEYLEFAQAFLRELFVAHSADCLATALGLLAQERFDALLIDQRFASTPVHRLTGELLHTAARLYFGDEARALAHLRDEQGTLILAALRAEGHVQRALFIHDFGARRLDNLRRLHGDVVAVEGFDATKIGLLLGGTAP
jgi:hypothetical protein